MGRLFLLSDSPPGLFLLPLSLLSPSLPRTQPLFGTCACGKWAPPSFSCLCLNLELPSPGLPFPPFCPLPLFSPHARGPASVSAHFPGTSGLTRSLGSTQQPWTRLALSPTQPGVCSLCRSPRSCPGHQHQGPSRCSAHTHSSASPPVACFEEGVFSRPLHSPFLISSPHL